ncbi:MAG: FadR family transcriptional regulator [Sneathiellales bacterium]|nr:FadR family transcriptional regulator [Sneathiellales bacterium]
MKTSSQSSPETLYEPVKGDPLAEKAARYIEELILDGLLQEESRLPGERDLATKLGISRPKLREALQLLEERGLVEIISGEGLYVAKLSGPLMLPALVSLYTRHPAALEDHLEFRRHQEGFAARLAAKRATSADHERLGILVAKMREADAAKNEEEASELDSRFHMSIVEAGYNRTLIHTMRSLYELNRSSIFLNRQELFERPDIAASLLAQHEALAAAILDGDAVKAEQLAMDHVDYVWKALKEALERKKREAISDKRQPL